MTSKDVKVGAKFGRWTVIQIGVKNPNSKAKNPPKMALCECSCEKHTKRYKEYRDLYSGRSLSCGCLRNEQVAERNKANSSVKVGNRYGYLEVVEDLGYRMQSRGKRESWYRCICHNCGNQNFESNGNNLQAGNTTSCGCVNSRGEALIREIFSKNNVNYSTQYSFSDLRSPLDYPLYFDFAVFLNNQLSFLIEFDGRQHYDGPEATWKETHSLQQIQEYDSLKNEYCKNNNIKLKRIPYFRIKDVTLETLMDETFTYTY